MASEGIAVMPLYLLQKCVAYEGCDIIDLFETDSEDDVMLYALQHVRQSIQSYIEEINSLFPQIASGNLRAWFLDRIEDLTALLVTIDVSILEGDAGYANTALQGFEGSVCSWEVIELAPVRL